MSEEYEVDCNKKLKKNYLYGEFLYMLFPDGIAEYQINFVDYVYFFVDVTFKALKSKELTIKEFMKFIKSNQTEQQKIAKEVYLLLSNHNNGEKINTLQIESLLYRYLQSTAPNKEARLRAIALNQKRHEEDEKLNKYIKDLHRSKNEMPLKKFYHTYEDDIIAFIKENCPKYYKKIQNDTNCVLFERVKRVFYRKK